MTSQKIGTTVRKEYQVWYQIPVTPAFKKLRQEITRLRLAWVMYLKKTKNKRGEETGTGEMVL